MTLQHLVLMNQVKVKIVRVKVKQKHQKPKRPAASQIVCKRSGNFKRKERSQQQRTFQGLACAWHPRKTPRKKTKTAPQETPPQKHYHNNNGWIIAAMSIPYGSFTMVGYMILTWLNFLETFAPGSPGKCSYTIFDIRTTPYYKILQPYHNSTTYRKTLQPHYLLQCTIAFYSVLRPYYCSVLRSATTVRLHTTTVLQCTHPHYVRTPNCDPVLRRTTTVLALLGAIAYWNRTTPSYNSTTTCYRALLHTMSTTMRSMQITM